MGADVPRVSRFILQVVEKQIREGAPPQTRETLARLVGEGYSEDEARQLIGAVVAAEMRAVVEEGRTFSEERFLALLRDLPRLP